MHNRFADLSVSGDEGDGEEWQIAVGKKMGRKEPARQLEAKAGANRDYAIAEMDDNYDKNRYCDCLPFNYNRVILHRHDEEDAGYINASHLRSKDFEQPEWEYIAAQGPLFDTVPEFWRMVYESGSQMIVMLTRTEEENIKGQMVDKCAAYWPQSVGAIMPQGNLMVKLDNEEMLSPELRRRELTLTCLDNDDVLPLTHIQHLTWPDHGLPPSSVALRCILALMRAAREAPPSVPHGGGPPIVHDSAGIGRTGVLVAADIALRQLHAARSPGDAKAAVDCKAIVQELRRQRMSMVHYQEQFAWLYRVLADEIKSLMT
ncbi:hypothetical protein WJX81_004844 [Elliptochloris bilobata]|uniref:Protein tyrosine phosphatase n=1 Tax=Elliptochloris bilobata TaxID=381761 RepID=A0AAW1S4X8_9CHLO